MNKKTVFWISNSYFIIFVVIFAIYVFNVADENWQVDFSEQKNNLFLFCFFALIGLIISSVALKGRQLGDNKISKVVVLGGIGLAIIVLVWRLLMAIV